MLKDEVILNLSAGKGGNGAVKLTGVRHYPTGGNGGKGGDVYLEGTTDYFDLNKYSREVEMKAEDGEIGGEHQRRGATGRDLVIKVPLTTEVYSADTGNLILTIDTPGQKELLLAGGEGGIGNYSFRASGLENLKKFTPGKKGKRVRAKLVLKLNSDVVFLGYPNAGKSSMLNALTNANVKVASYAFTTLAPHLGRIQGLTLMDLPGLIVGTHEEKGLGTGFVKHTEKAKLAAHFVSLENEDVLKAYTDMREELGKISQELIEKDEVIILTKADEFSEEEIQAKLKQLDSIDKEKIVCSVIDDEALQRVRDLFVRKIRG